MKNSTPFVDLNSKGELTISDFMLKTTLLLSNLWNEFFFKKTISGMNIPLFNVNLCLKNIEALETPLFESSI